MKKFTKKQIILFLVLIALALLSGCQRNTDSNGNTLAEKIIYLNTPWASFFADEDFLSALLVYPLAQAINFVGQYTGAVAAVMIVTVVYNLLILPLTIKSTASTQKMQMLQPELQKLQEKYAGNQDEQANAKYSQEIQKLYAKYDINPLGSMIMPFLQFPILIAMYYSVQRAAAVCEGSFMGVSLTTTPKAAFGDIANKWPIALIFVLMIVAQFASSLIPQMLAKKAKKKQKGYKEYKDNSNNSQTNIMMIMMVLMVGFIGLSWPVSMSVYWLINSIVNVTKTVFIQRKYVDHE